jgi:methionine synthase II (cobalamin-independent)
MIRPPPFRAEHIGSLVRPPELLRAREQYAAGKLDREGLAAVENAAIARVVKLQEDLGLQVVTDGEFRRGTYSDAFTSAGISGVKIEMTEEQGWTSSQSHGHRMARRIPRVKATRIGLELKTAWRQTPSPCDRPWQKNQKIPGSKPGRRILMK